MLSSNVDSVSFLQQHLDRLQFETPLGGGPGMRHFELPHRVHDDLGDDEPRVDFVVGGDHVPRCMVSAGSTKAVFVGLHVLLPVLPLVNVSSAELPVLVGLVYAGKESLLLFLIREVEKYLDGLGAIAMKMLLNVHNGLKPLLPDVLIVAQLLGESLTAENLGMHSDDQYLFIIGTVKDADAAALRKPADCAPQKIVLQFVCAGLLETDNLTTRWINTRHYVPNGAIFPRAVHPLENEEQRVTVGRKVEFLQRAQLVNVFFEKALIQLLRFAEGLYDRRPLVEIDFLSGRNTEVL